MANSLLTLSLITREAVRLWKNSNAFIQNIDMQYDDSFAQSGAKIGSQLRIRLPNDYTVRTGAAASVQDTSEQQTVLTLATQIGVDVAFSTFERTMNLDDFSERVLSPAINNIAGSCAATIMAGSEAGGIANLTPNLDVSGNLLSPVAATYLAAGANLTNNSAPLGRRKVVNDPLTESRTVNSLAGLFNPSAAISRQYQTGMMQQALGLDWFADQTAIKHTTGTFTAGTVNGANQTGLTLVTNAITGTLNQGDIITIAAVNQVNRITKQSLQTVRQFVVTANVLTGAVSIPIYPALIPGVAGNAVQYQTVDVSPANGAAISLVLKPGITYRKNIAYAPEAVTMATADLEMPGPNGVEEVARAAFDGLSMRMVTQYQIGTDQKFTRLDLLFGFLYVRPEWGVIVPDVI